MTKHVHGAISGGIDDRYATHEDFLKVFLEDMNALYQLSFLLTADHQKAEKCFVDGIEQCAKASLVFQEWAGTWAKRVIVENAIREIHPRRGHFNSSSLLSNAFPHRHQASASIDFVNGVLELADFERFVFVLRVLERYRDHECALLLSCSARDVRAARLRAIEQLANRRLRRSNRHEDHERSGRTQALGA